MQLPGAPPKLIGATEYVEGFGIAVDPPLPDGPARLPLILFSHGLGGSPISPGHIDAMVDLASRGFMVAAVFHGDWRFSQNRNEDHHHHFYVRPQFDELVEIELMRPRR